MNIFILNTGRCGSTTFIEACRHISNFSAGHESRIHLTGEQRLAYPANHIEADNRLSWLLGRLDRAYGNDAFYLHLRRNRTDTTASFARRQHMGIMKAYREGILLNGDADPSAEEIARDYIDTVESNIALFLRNKSHWMSFDLERAADDFSRFWQWIGAEGDLERALQEWQVSHNASQP